MIAVNQTNLNQKSIKKSIKFSGVGLHTGEHVKLILEQAPEDSGIKFIRTDKKYNNIIEALWSNVSATNLCTTISNNNLSVSTIEHLMSALSGLHIDNLNIYIDGPEVPIMDGSSKPFVELIEKNGINIQNKKRKILKVKREIYVSNTKGSVRLIPNNQFSIDFDIDFPSSVVSKQSCQLQLINGNYKTDIASARTFGFEKDVENLRSNGFALGGSLENAVVVGSDKILNKGGLRFKDEFVRHKILDSIGDLYLAGAPIEAYFFGKKSGHNLNIQLLRELFSDYSNFEFIN